MKISVFTCTYNRLDTLRRTFDALKQQTFTDFEWVLVDNGSTDGTVAAVEEWIKEVEFPVTIHRIEKNSGFQNAYNAGIALCSGEFFVNLDSDDSCVPHALERFIELWGTVPDQDKESFVGVTVNCEDQYGSLVGDSFPKDPLDSNSLETELRYRIKGEKFGILRLDVLRKFPFPASEFHINPSIVWRAISREYQTRYTNDILRIYYINEKDREDQVTFHLNSFETAYGKWLNSRAMLNEYMDWFFTAPFIFLKNAMNYSRNAFLLDHSLGDQISDIQTIAGKILVMISMPYGKLWSFLARKKLS